MSNGFALDKKTFATDTTTITITVTHNTSIPTVGSTNILESCVYIASSSTSYCYLHCPKKLLFIYSCKSYFSVLEQAVTAAAFFPSKWVSYLHRRRAKQCERGLRRVRQPV